MAISKLILNGVTQMDVTQDTVAPENLFSGETATGADGEPVVGEYVPASPTLQTKSVSYTPTESAQSATVTADQGYDGLDEVNVSVGAIPSQYIVPTGTKTITENGTGIDVSAFEFADVNVSGGGGDQIADLIENTLTTYTYTGTADLPQTLFRNKTTLVSASFPNVTAIVSSGTGYTFGGCSNLETVSFPELVTLNGGSSFDSCPKLSAIFPKLQTINGTNSFAYGTNGNHIYVFPALTTISGTDTFRASGTNVLDFGAGLTSLPNRTFYGSTAYTTVIFRCSTQVVVATSDNSIGGINQSTTIYIPKALYDHLGDESALDYRSATNWAAKTTTTFACIEGSQYENYYADGTPIPTT